MEPFPFCSRMVCWWEFSNKQSPSPTWQNIFPIVHDRDECSNREQSETNRNDENAMW